MKILLVGTGYMALEYAKSLLQIECNFIVVGNSDHSCDKFREQFPNNEIISGGIEKCDLSVYKFTHAIIASPILLLPSHLIQILDADITNILVEKPGGVDVDTLEEIILKYKSANIYVAYNRRFYDSVNKAREIIEDDGGVTSFTINVTELVHLIDTTKFSKEVLGKWFLAMTSHVVDMAFFLCGKPADLICHHGGSLSWHPTEIFIGCGQTEAGVPFTYHGNWGSAGRWRIEICTRKHLLLFCPLEKLQIQNRGELTFSEVPITSGDIKDGVYGQTYAFIKCPEDDRLLTLAEQCFNIRNIYDRMASPVEPDEQYINDTDIL